MGQLNNSITSLRMRYLGSASYILLAFCSLCINLLVLACFLKLRSQLKRIVFFTIAGQMLICDLVNIFVEVILVVPESLAGQELYPKFVVKLIGFIDSLGFRAYLFFAFFLTLNRLAIFVFPRLDYFVFSREHVFRRCLIFIWALATFYLVLIALAGCYKDFDVNNMATVHSCPEDTYSEYLAKKSRTLISASFPLAMLFIYLMIFLKLQFIARGHNCIVFALSSLGLRSKKSLQVKNLTRSAPQTSAKEMNFFIQGLVICVVLELEGLTYDALHGIEIEGELIILPKFFQMWMNVVSFTVHSVILLIFNNIIRRTAKEIVLRLLPLVPEPEQVVATVEMKRSLSKIEPAGRRFSSQHHYA